MNDLWKWHEFLSMKMITSIIIDFTVEMKTLSILQWVQIWNHSQKGEFKCCQDMEANRQTYTLSVLNLVFWCIQQCQCLHHNYLIFQMFIISTISIHSEVWSCLCHWNMSVAWWKEGLNILRGKKKKKFSTTKALKAHTSGKTQLPLFCIYI